MNEAGAGGFAHSIRLLWDEGTATGLDDAALIERFLRRDPGAETAFAVLVRRHAPMVVRVCRDVIGDPHDAQDAAQAAFLILARNASTIARRDSIAGWLYGTARRVAMRSVRDTARRRRHERRYAESAAERPGSGDGIPGSGRDWSGLYEELDRLPERYRAPIVLCDLEGRTHEQAASALGCPARTLQTRLYRGRERLRSRLTRRGLLPAAGIAGGLFSSEAGAGFVPASWISATSLAATRLATGRASAAGLSATVATLIEGVNRAMFLTQLKWAAVFAGFAVLSAGVTIGLASGDGRQPTPGVAGRPKPSARKASTPAPAKIQGTLNGILTDLAGKPIAASLNLSGRATDLAGKPIAGASIFLVSTNGITKDLGQTTTDGGGNYRFSNILLPLRPQTEDTPSQGTFQVYGTAPGFGFAWHGMRTYLPKNRPLGEGINGEEYRLFQDDPIVMDIHFPPAATLGGRIVDEAGRPVSGAEVQLFSCDYLDTKDREEHLNYREFLSIRQTPKALRTATTGPDGSFRMEGLSKEAGFWIHVEHPSYAWFRLFAATTDRPVADFTYPLDQTSDPKRPPVFTGDLKITLRSNRKVVIQTVFADSREPAPMVKVSASRGTSGSSAYGTSNEQGKLELKLPPGEYDFLADPTERGVECISTQTVFTVLDADEQSLEIPVNPGAIVLLEVVDAETGKGIPGIQFFRAKPGMSSVGLLVQSRTGYQDNPRSDADGRIRAIVEPGDWKYMPTYLPEKVGYLLYNGYKPAWLVPRKTTTLRFELKHDQGKIPERNIPITGRIVDLEGRPIPGVSVKVASIASAKAGDLSPWLEAVRRGEARWMVRKHLEVDREQHQGKAETDVQGRFRLEGLGTEKVVTLSIEGPTVAHTQLPVVTRPIEPFSARGFPNNYGPGTATIYGADFTLTAAPGRMVEGVIRDARDGKVMKDVDVWSYGFAGTDISGGLGSLKARTDGEGRFRLGGFPMGPGNTLLIVPNDDQPYFMREVALPDPKKRPGAVPVEIGLHRGIWIEGKVTDQETGSPVAGACLRYLPLLDNKSAQAAPEFHPGGLVDGGFYEQRYASKSDGTYRLVGLPGRAIVGAVVFSGKPYRRGAGAESIRGVGEMGTEFATYANPVRASRYYPHSMKEINPAEGAETVHLDIALDPGAKVHLRVVDPQGEPLTGVKTAGRRERGQYDDEAQAQAEFDVVTLQPGEHRLVLLVHEGRKLGRVIQVKEGDDKNGPAVVTLERTATIAGRIVDPDGKPVSGAIIRCKPLPGDNFYIKLPELVSGRDGRFTIPDVPTGCGYMGVVYTAGKFGQLKIAFENVTVRPGETTDVGDIRFKVDRQR